MNVNQLFKNIEERATERYRSFMNGPLVDRVERFARRLVLPGFDGMPLYDVLTFFIKGLSKGALTLRAAAFTYNSFIAIFPAIIFFFTIIPYIPIPHFQDNLLALLRDLIPFSVYETVESTLFDIVKRPRGGLLSLGFVLALYFATNGVNSLIEAFNQTYHSLENRSFVLQRLVSVLLVLIMALMVILAIGLITAGPPLMKMLVDLGLLHRDFVYYLLQSSRWLIILSLFFFGYSFLYYLGPSKRKTFRFISAGSSLATFLSIALSSGFNYYVNNFSSYNKLYGSIGTLMIVMLWIYFNGLIILIGFELNASIYHARQQVIADRSTSISLKDEIE